MLIVYKPMYTQRMDGRYFAGRRVEASLYFGRQRFKRGGAEGPELGDGQEAEKQRLDDFAKWLMSEED